MIFHLNVDVDRSDRSVARAAGVAAPLLKLMLIIVGLLAGCQRYEKRPLDLGGHVGRVADRSPTGREVADFAAALSSRRAKPEAYDPADGLTLAEAEAVCLFFNPQLRAARLEANVPLAGAKEAGRWEDPMLGVDGERIIESVDKPWVLGSTLGVTIPLSGRLKVERRRAFAEAGVEQARVYLQEQETIADLRQRWVEWTEKQELLDLTRGYVSDLDGLIAASAKLADLGELSRNESRLFEIERASRLVEVLTLEASVQDAHLQLKAMMGLAPHADVRLVPSLRFDDEPAGAAYEPQAAVEANPRLRVAVAEYELAEHALNAEVRKQYPDLTIGGGGGTEDGQSRILFGGSIPLPLWNRNRQGIAEALASRTAAKASAEAVYESLVHDLARAAANLESARRRITLLEGTLVPLVDRQVEEARELSRLGEFQSLVVLEGRRSAFEAKVRVVEARSAEAAAVVELRTLIGPSIGSPPQHPQDKP